MNSYVQNPVAIPTFSGPAKRGQVLRLNRARASTG